MELLVRATGEVPVDLAALTPAERARAAALHDPADFVAAHLLARTAVTRLTGAPDVILVQHCPVCGGDHGPPTVADRPEVSVSWSHSHGHLAAVAGYEPVGVDLEVRGRRHDVPRLVRRTATPAEATRILGSDDPALAYLRMWVAKEALVKVGALAVGDFGAVDVTGGYPGFVVTVRERPAAVVGLARAQQRHALDVVGHREQVEGL